MEKQEKNHAVSHVSSYVLIDGWMVTWETGWGDASGWTQPAEWHGWFTWQLNQPHG